MTIKSLLVFVAIIQAVVIAYFLGHHQQSSQPRAGHEAPAVVAALADEAADRHYRAGMQMLSQQGAPAARAFFEQQYRYSGHLKLLYGLAWTQYIQSESDAAQRNLTYILDHQPQPELAAHCHYLAGYMALNDARYQQAVDAFRAAHLRYTQADKQSNLFKCELGLAGAAVFQARYDDADILLNIAFSRTADTQIKHLGHFYHLKARVCFGRGRYAAALAFAEKELAEFEKIGDVINTGVAHGDIAFYRAVKGDFAGCIAANQRAETLLTQQGATGKLVQTQLNRLFIAQCRGEVTQDLEQVIRQHIERQNDQYAREQLDFLKTWSCP